MLSWAYTRHGGTAMIRFSEERFVRIRHWYLLALLLMFAGIIYMGSG